MNQSWFNPFYANPLNVLNHYDLKRDDLLLERGGFHLFIYLFTLYIIISL